MANWPPSILSWIALSTPGGFKITVRVLLLVSLVLTTGCGILAPPLDLPSAQSGQPGLSAVTPASTSHPAGFAQTTPAALEPAASPSATPTSSPTATFTVTSSPTPTLHPMNILAQRQTPYPGSEIIIEETLEPGANYSRYIASYQSEGLKIYALLTVPYGDTPETGWPAIVFNHGYIPPNVYRTTERYIAYVDSLASHGYIVFRIDYRGHDRSEGTATGAYGHPGYTVDVLNAVAALKSFPQADPNRIGMWGHSLGGYLTLRAMVISPDVNAGVIWAGVVASYPDLLARWRRGSGPTSTPNPSSARRWRMAWLEQFGTPEENPDFWNAVSANSYLQDISGPVQLHHGTADHSVPLEFSEILYQQLQGAGKPAELYTYEGDDHNISNSFSIAMTRSIEFFDRYLK